MAHGTQPSYRAILAILAVLVAGCTPKSIALTSSSKSPIASTAVTTGKTSAYPIGSPASATPSPQSNAYPLLRGSHLPASEAPITPENVKFIELLARWDTGQYWNNHLYFTPDGYLLLGTMDGPGNELWNANDGTIISKNPGKLSYGPYNNHPNEAYSLGGEFSIKLSGTAMIEIKAGQTPAAGLPITISQLHPKRLHSIQTAETSHSVWQTVRFGSFPPNRSNAKLFLRVQRQRKFLQK